MKKYVLFFCLMLSTIVRAEVKMFFQPDTVAAGESSVLVFQSDKPFSKQPDLSGLDENFIVGGVAQSTFQKVINGQSDVLYRMSYTVFPKKEGALATGSVVVGGKRLNSAVLNVQYQKNKTNSPTVMVKAMLNKTEVYPGEMVLLTLKITDPVGVGHIREVRPLSVPNARVIPLGRSEFGMPIVYAEKNYVIEENYAIIPEKSGTLTIPPVSFVGYVPVNNTPSALFDWGSSLFFSGMVSGQKEIEFSSDEVKIMVRNKPENWLGWWLPAKKVTVSEDGNLPETVAVGDTVSRKITLTAVGTAAEQLPVIVQPATQSFKVYPAPEERTNRLGKDSEIIGTEIVTVDLVPTEAGKIIIPEIKIPWFNLSTGQTENAILPAVVLNVTGEVTTVPEIQNNPIQKQAVQPPIPPVVIEKKGIGLLGVFGAVSAGVLVGGGLAWFLMRRRPSAGMHRGRSGRKKKKPLPDLYPF